MDILHYQDSKAYVFSEAKIGKATYSPFVITVLMKKPLGITVTERGKKEEFLFQLLKSKIGFRFYFVEVYHSFLLLERLEGTFTGITFDKNGNLMSEEENLKEVVRQNLRAGCLPLNVITFTPDSESYHKEELYIPLATKYDKNPPVYLEGKRYQYSNLLNRLARDKFQCKTK